MRTLTAYTYEIDNINNAVNEVLQQLDLKKNLGKNSVGFISCYSEFIESGVVKELCAALPFEVIGCTTMANGSCGENSFIMLTITVLTGDDVYFGAALSKSVNEKYEERLLEAFNVGKEKIKGEPKFILVFAPLLTAIDGEQVFDAIDKASKGIPIFGTVSCDHTEDYHTSQVIYNGEGFASQVSLVVIGGNINPRFFVMATDESKALKQKAIVTESNGNLLIGVNDMSFLDYLKTIGLSEGSTEGINGMPLIIDYNDGTPPVTRSAMWINSEGYAVCGGKVPIGSTLAIGVLDNEDVVKGAKDLIEKAKNCMNNGTILMFTCISRLLVLGFDSEAELEIVKTGLKDTQYLIAYSGGEMCPVTNESGKQTNRFHNSTLVAVVF